MYFKEYVLPGMQQGFIWHFDFSPVCIDCFEWYVGIEYRDIAEEGVNREKEGKFKLYIVTWYFILKTSGLLRFWG